jgi:hypothetical protein
MGYEDLFPKVKDFLKYIGGYEHCDLIPGQFYEVINVNYTVVGFYKVLVIGDTGYSSWVPLNYFYFED